jgi:hypothetical protein
MASRSLDRSTYPDKGVSSERFQRATPCGGSRGSPPRLTTRPVHSRGPPPCPGPESPASAVPIGTANPIPANASSFPGAAIDTTTPMTIPWAFRSGPPELPGLTAASNLDQPGQRARFGLSLAVQTGNDPGRRAVPQPQRVADGHHIRADGDTPAEGCGDHNLGELPRNQRGDVNLRVCGGDRSGCLGSVGEQGRVHGASVCNDPMSPLCVVHALRVPSTRRSSSGCVGQIVEQVAAERVAKPSNTAGCGVRCHREIDPSLPRLALRF